jgi:hypothetical protein
MTPSIGEGAGGGGAGGAVDEKLVMNRPALSGPKALPKISSMAVNNSPLEALVAPRLRKVQLVPIA